MFRQTAELYDRFYDWKDYAGEAEKVRQLVAERAPDARTLLDVACGTGRHLEHLRRWFAVEGIDHDDRLLNVARHKLPDVPLHVADMRSLDLGRTFDAVTCLFSSIGYARGLDGLASAAASLARHVAPAGVLIVEPWLSPDRFYPAHRARPLVVETDDLVGVRLNGARVEGRTSVMDFHYLLRSSASDHVEHREEIHELDLFTNDEYRAAFEATGLRVEHDPEGLMGRGLWIARRSGSQR